MKYVTENHRAWLEGNRDSPMTREEAIKAHIELTQNPSDDILNGFYNNPISLKIINLGFTPKEIKELKGKRVLDIGCGSKSSLVYWMRELEIEAEGIDPRVEGAEQFLIKQFMGRGR